jgi:hypothetical protein
MGTPLQFAVANLHSSNRDLSSFAKWISDTQPSIVGVLEVSPHHLEDLAKLGYEYRVVEPRANNFGIAFLGKEEPLSSSLLGQETSFPSILVEYDDFQVLITHPMPPISKEARQIGDEQVEQLAQLVQRSKKPTVVLGDLNATGWDMRLFPLLDAGLKDGREGHGLVTTWPVGNPLMGIGIDHVMVPENWSVNQFRRGPDIGSDHYPLAVTVETPL